MLQRTSLYLQPKAFNALGVHTPPSIQERGAFIVWASSDVDGIGGGSADPLPEVREEVVPVENLPLESKQQLMLEQKQRMKLAKKIRLRRKRLVRKRRMRKKGRWPPSKMKKNKNV
ncbi:50S ribosomal protein 5 alpha protein [Thalictrum thalictroides]|uniref:50S ribosomal protein 5 alpha protein n=1 Tax=Thalictrum thalictroides TaxID=46969 RepID=A0A7J6V3C6_THATH|nr:50S ribosomal protein 5 alpha protein [Thalictrum thalictroides]